MHYIFASIFPFLFTSSSASSSSARGFVIPSMGHSQMLGVTEIRLLSVLIPPAIQFAFPRCFRCCMGFSIWFSTVSMEFIHSGLCSSSSRLSWHFFTSLRDIYRRRSGRGLFFQISVILAHALHPVIVIVTPSMPRQALRVPCSHSIRDCFSH